MRTAQLIYIKPERVGQAHRYQIVKMFGDYRMAISDFQYARLRDCVVEADLDWARNKGWNIIVT